MDVAPHPHIGLQTVTWLLDGEVIHDDSLGCEAIARPGGVNVMTSGRGIAHAEQTPVVNSGRLNGVQLWVALPDAYRHREPAFEGIERVPAAERPGGVIQVFAGRLAGVAAPAAYYSEIVGADLEVHAGRELEIELNPGFEFGVVVLGGNGAMDGTPLVEKNLYYLGAGRGSASFSSRAGGRFLLIGGPPFPEPVLMWWNFVARTPEEIAEARADWEQRRRFSDVTAYRGARLAAPELARFARPNPMS